ncbi:thioredoxin-like domain protein [Bordetella holmesii CDC-H635-BH]|uniref:Thiol:disulfide interchange protein n=2 Tax=Bordetella holmesii TaxID=35814 RepID=A0A158M162_9BORD|nr:dihydroneopterin aldolase [Bordetella holmesii F627]KAK76951.1 thioredoxin-like domain protein [Bordetella holmesii CDC-H809-BH]KAK84364.1 thioredoxin-like domain protein [Bordetella holmesii CDC-H572-BH]KAK88426.1 thioredoxin-like domain protein [Bordetella holmesii CDC-H585-BH]KAK89541.1 thioredoxin-like domain protein [Bordetella holmesii CDC-H635-BH]KCV07522.1 thioredoxin-like domain protein [Bordetella holmesii CDC-H785-BH]KCV16415.1 thioredoxin-like domain protein [Bordetella holmesi
MAGERQNVVTPTASPEAAQPQPRRPNSQSETVWHALSEATWVADGRQDAPRVVYTFSDPNCPYCNRFSETARPWVQAGKVQLRHILIGIINASSSTKAAAILGASDPTAALIENERNFRQGGIKPAASVPEVVRTRLTQNHDLMAKLGFRGTPGIVYLDDQGRLQRLNGLPRTGGWERILGHR